MFRYLIVVVSFLLAALISACTGSSGTRSASGTTEVTVALQIPDTEKAVFRVMTSSTQASAFNNYTSRLKIPADVVTVVITTSGADFDPIVVTKPVSLTQFPVKLNVPNGDNRTITIEGKSAAGTVAYIGKATMAKLDGTPVELPVAVTYSLGLSKVYGGAKNDDAYTGRQTSDGGFFVTAGTRSFGAYSTSTLAMRLKSNGSVKWQKAYSPSATLAALGYSVTEMFGSPTSDGGSFMVGNATNKAATRSHVLAAKFNSQGNPMWVRMFAVTGAATTTQSAVSYDFTSDGGYVISANANANSFVVSKTNGFWFLKLGAEGALEWNMTTAGTSQELNAVIRPLGGSSSFVVAGLVNVSVLPALGVFKVTSGGISAAPAPVRITTGNIWPSATPYSQVTTDGGLIVSVLSGGAAPDIWVVKFDQNLVIQWQKFYSLAGGVKAGPIAKAADGGTIMSGSTTNGDILAFKLDQGGSISWSRTYSRAGSNTVSEIQENSDGTVTITGQNTSPQGDKDIWLIKTDTTGAVPGVTPLLGNQVSLTSTNTIFVPSASAETMIINPAITVSNPILSVTTTNTVPAN